MAERTREGLAAGINVLSSAIRSQSQQQFDEQKEERDFRRKLQLLGVAHQQQFDLLRMKHSLDTTSPQAGMTQSLLSAALGAAPTPEGAPASLPPASLPVAARLPSAAPSSEAGLAGVFSNPRVTWRMTINAKGQPSLSIAPKTLKPPTAPPMLSESQTQEMLAGSSPGTPLSTVPLSPAGINTTNRAIEMGLTESPSAGLLNPPPSAPASPSLLGMLTSWLDRGTHPPAPAASGEPDLPDPAAYHDGTLIQDDTTGLRYRLRQGQWQRE